MLGAQLADFQGKSTGMRVLPGDDYRDIKIEISFQQQGTMLGQPANDIGTYTFFERVPGQACAEGRGITTTADGQSAIWNGDGIGRMEGEGMEMTVRFSLAYQAPTEGSLARLNGGLVVGEQASHEDGSFETRTWEWK